MADCSNLLQQGLQLVQTATKLDASGDYSEALRHYSLALEAFLSVLKMEKNPRIKLTLSGKVNTYMNRAEELKELLEGSTTINSANSSLHLPSPPIETPSHPTSASTAPPVATYSFPSPPSVLPNGGGAAPISDWPKPTLSSAPHTPPTPKTATTLRLTYGQVGIDYQSLFGFYMNESSNVLIAEHSYFIQHPHQIANIVRFCELCVKSGCIKAIYLHTSTENETQRRFIVDALSHTKKSLFDYGVDFNLNIAESGPESLTNCILFSNGWKLEIDRGLDFYLPPQATFAIGAFDWSLRPVQDTVVTISKGEITNNIAG